MKERRIVICHTCIAPGLAAAIAARLVELGSNIVDEPERPSSYDGFHYLDSWIREMNRYKKMQRKTDFVWNDRKRKCTRKIVHTVPERRFSLKRSKYNLAMRRQVTDGRVD